MEDKAWKKVNDKPVKKVRKLDQDLLNAAYFGNAPLCRKFIAMGADVEFMEDRDGWLGIHYAARWGDMSMLKSYVKAGANIDGKTNSKETALHKCGRWDRKEAALYLLSLGANPACKNGDGNKASDMTADPEMKFLLDNYGEYVLLQEERKKEKLEKERQEKESGVGFYSPKNYKTKSFGSSNNSVNSKSTTGSPKPHRSVTSY